MPAAGEGRERTWKPRANGTRWGLAWWWYAVMALGFGLPALLRLLVHTSRGAGLAVDLAALLVFTGGLLVLPYEFRNQRRHKHANP